MKQRRKKEEKETVVCPNLGANLYKMWCGIMWCVEPCWEIWGQKCHSLYTKKDICMSLQIFLMFLSRILVDI